MWCVGVSFQWIQISLDTRTLIDGGCNTYNNNQHQRWIVWCWFDEHVLKFSDRNSSCPRNAPSFGIASYQMWYKALCLRPLFLYPLSLYCCLDVGGGVTSTLYIFCLNEHVIRNRKERKYTKKYISSFRSRDVVHAVYAVFFLSSSSFVRLNFLDFLVVM